MVARVGFHFAVTVEGVDSDVNHVALKGNRNGLAVTNGATAPVAGVALLVEVEERNERIHHGDYLPQLMYVL